MKNFWPPRSKAKGFLIKSFTRKYRKDIPGLSVPKISNQFLAKSNYKEINEDCNNIKISTLNREKKHWANRDFSEYKQAA